MRKNLTALSRTRVVGLSLVCLLFWGGSVRAHPPWDDQLEVLEEQIREEPLNASLYVRRADLKKELGNTRSALIDYDRASEIDPELDLVDLGRGLLYLGIEDPTMAQFFLDRFLDQNPEHAKALLASARALRQLGELDLAASRYERAIGGFKVVKPAFFVELAEVQIESGDHHAAIKTLDEGMRRFGPLTSLQIRAIDILDDQGNTQKALIRLDRLTESSPQTARWLLRRGELLESAGRLVEAEAAYVKSRSELDKQMKGSRKNRSLVALERRLIRAQKRLESPVSSQGEAS
ncbi:MAG: tetratricopeptide repeat protein [Thermoanaerobaculia bacterium]